MKKALTAIVLLTSLNVSATSINAPFGFEWGQSKADIKSKGVVLKNCTEKNKIYACETTKPPKGVSFGESYNLYIDYEKGLQKVVLIGVDIKSDITGSDGKEQYSKIKSSLTKKYGEPTPYETIGQKLYKEYDEFYQCLKYDGCGQWFSVWSPDNDGAIVLQLKGLSRGKGYLTLVYESKEWAAIMDSFEDRKNTSDEGAL